MKSFSKVAPLPKANLFTDQHAEDAIRCRKKNGLGIKNVEAPGLWCFQSQEIM